MSQLIEALKRKYRTPHDAKRALGLDPVLSTTRYWTTISATSSKGAMGTASATPKIKLRSSSATEAALQVRPQRVALFPSTA